MKYRTFGGKKFLEAYDGLRKREAEKLAKMNRQSGNKARVVKTGKGSLAYSVFIRRYVW